MASAKRSVQAMMQAALELFMHFEFILAVLSLMFNHVYVSCQALQATSPVSMSMFAGHCSTSSPSWDDGDEEDGDEARSVSPPARSGTASASAAVVHCQKVKIPLMSSAESLNAAVACAVIVGEAMRQRAAT
jgi:tRNA(Leu) C34 or U34 (ribose-2'-O)-methylase TrmL